MSSAKTSGVLVVVKRKSTSTSCEFWTTKTIRTSSATSPAHSFQLRSWPLGVVGSRPAISAATLPGVEFPVPPDLLEPGSDDREVGAGILLGDRLERDQRQALGLGPALVVALHQARNELVLDVPRVASARDPRHPRLRAPALPLAQAQVVLHRPVDAVQPRVRRPVARPSLVVVAVVGPGARLRATGPDAHLVALPVIGVKSRAPQLLHRPFLQALALERRAVDVV